MRGAETTVVGGKRLGARITKPSEAAPSLAGLWFALGWFLHAACAPETQVLCLPRAPKKAVQRAFEGMVQFISFSKDEEYTRRGLLFRLNNPAHF